MLAGEGQFVCLRLEVAFLRTASRDVVLFLANLAARSTNDSPRCRVPSVSRPTAVHHIAIKVLDLARAEHFFVQTLGLVVLRRWPAQDGSGERSLWLDLGAGAFLALEKSSNQSEPLAPDASGLHLLALRIERAERQAWIDRLARAGVPLYQQTAFTINCKDPEGNRIGLSHWPDPI